MAMNQETEAEQPPDRTRPEDAPARWRQNRAVLTVVVVAVVVLVGLLVSTVVVPAMQMNDAYRQATRLLENEAYELATEAFLELGDYRDSEAKAEHAASFGAAVPDVLGMTVAEARETLIIMSLALGELDYDETSAQEPGTIIGQEPAAAGYASGNPVMLTVAGFPPVEMPSLSGFDRPEAEAQLTAAGLKLGRVTESYDESIAAGLLLSQTPDSGLEVPHGSSVELVFSRGPEPREVPDVTGQTQAEAVGALTAIGFKAEAKTANRGTKKGTVLSQDPAKGTMAQPGSVVTITVSSGARMVTVPNLDSVRESAYGNADSSRDILDQVLSAVRSAASARGLKVRFQLQPAPMRQSPAAGASVPEGTTVTVWIPAG